MSLIDDARQLVAPLEYAGLRDRGQISGWEAWSCGICGEETLKGYHKEIQHESDCPWRSLPAIVAALEAASLFLRARSEAHAARAAWDQDWTDQQAHARLLDARRAVLSAEQMLADRMSTGSLEVEQ